LVGRDGECTKGSQNDFKESLGWDFLRGLRLEGSTSKVLGNWTNFDGWNGEWISDFILKISSVGRMFGGIESINSTFLRIGMTRFEKIVDNRIMHSDIKGQNSFIFGVNCIRKFRIEFSVNYKNNLILNERKFITLRQTSHHKSLD